jgi:thiamine-phosphate pyrophosphorylase
MELFFTPGAQRALTEAAAWSSGIGLPELEAPALLLGLLAESECRAAIALAALSIDQEAVQQRWPGLSRVGFSADDEQAPVGLDRFDLDRAEEVRKRLPRFSDELAIAMAVIRRRFRDCPPPLMLATEHLLLGLAASGREVSLWLTARGLDPLALEVEILRRNGYEAQPPPLEPASLPADSVSPGPVKATELVPPVAAPAWTRSTTSPTEQIAALRALDAAANRAMEGLRVAEDYVRFSLDDRHLTEQLKRLRHDLAAALARVPMASRLAARETLADVGTSLSTAAEQSRPALADVLSANVTRVEEALRSLEEFGKLVDKELAAQAKQLRYRVYTIQRAAEITRTSLDRLDHARLYVLVDGAASPEAFAARIESLVEAGVHVIQLRDKRLDDRLLLARARLLHEITIGTSTLFIVNDRPDIARLAGADGVHVGQEELTVKDARAIVGPEALVGVSTHSLAQAQQAVLDGANYLGVGPTFPSGTKHFQEFPGLELLRAVAAEIRLPVFAIGGITRENLAQVLYTGMRRIAVSGAVATATDPATVVRELLAVLG